MAHNVNYIKNKTDNNLLKLISNISYERFIPKGDYIYSEGDISNKVYLVKSGIVKIGKLAGNGKEISLRMCKKDDIFGDLTLYSENIFHYLHARVFQEARILVVKKEQLEKSLYDDKQLTIEYMKNMSSLIRRDEPLFRDLILYAKKGALCSTLIRLTNTYGSEQHNGCLITISMTNKELAGFCGTSRESVNRMLSRLRKKEVISVKDGLILVHDLDYLRSVVDYEENQSQLRTMN